MRIVVPPLTGPFPGTRVVTFHCSTNSKATDVSEKSSPFGDNDMFVLQLCMDGDMHKITDCEVNMAGVAIGEIREPCGVCNGTKRHHAKPCEVGATVIAMTVPPDNGPK